jgi:PAS domain S-box-containing protein
LPVLFPLKWPKLVLLMTGSNFKPNTALQYQFLSGGGRMGNLMRNKDWSLTSVGTPDTWPQSLRTTLSILLNSKFPMFLWWGPELICFYNDAYRPSLGENGKHPQILGMPAKNAWSEIWHIIKPLIDQVLEGGESTWSEDQLIPIYRNGKIEDVYWTFSYSPVSDEFGKVVAVLVTCTETTEHVKYQNKLKEDEERLKIIIAASELGTWELNLATKAVQYSNRYLEILGHPHDAILSHSQIVAQLHPDDLHVREKAFKAAFETGILHYESRIFWRDRSLHWVEGRGKVFYNDKGQPCKLIGTVRDITEAKNHQQKLEEREQKFRLLADSMPQLVWTGDAKGNLNYFNRAVYDYSGFSSKDIEEEGWLQIVHPDDREANLKTWSNAVNTGTDFIFEHRFKKYDGTYRWQLSRAIPQKDAAGKIQMWVGSSTDIQEMKEQDQQKDFFISMASHELKTPITSIKGYVQILQSSYAKSEDGFLKNSLKVIDKQILTLTSLISDLLDVSKIKSGSLVLNKEHFEITDLVEEVVGEIKHINPDFSISFSRHCKATVFADKGRIGQVLINLLNNAVKYSPKSRRVTVENFTNENAVIVSVEDSGIGISKTDQEKIFERFYRVEGKNETTFPGFGIGLYIASEIIKRHDGEIGVTSEPDKGSVFFFSIPLFHN